MASGDERASAPEELSGEGLTVAVIRSRWNEQIVDRLAEGAQRGLDLLGVEKTEHISVPGSFEIPIAAKFAAESGRIDAIVCVGAVIRGETTHYELVSDQAATGIQNVQLATGVPVAFGLLTVENEAQALARSEGPGGHNVGEEAALVAVEMAQLRSQWIRRPDLTTRT